MTLPDRWSLGQNVPNPFNPSTTISFTVPQGGGQVTLTVRAGFGSASGGRLPSGVYFYRLNAAGMTETRKMVITR